MKLIKPVNLFVDMKQATAFKRGQFLGLDVGDKYVGIAISNHGSEAASPWTVWVRKKDNIDDLIPRFQKLISKFSPLGVIVGMPYDRLGNSKDGLVNSFINGLHATGKLTDLKYTYWGERFTSKNANLLVWHLTMNPVDSNIVSDQYAAVGILQGFLDWTNKMKLKDNEDDLR